MGQDNVLSYRNAAAAGPALGGGHAMPNGKHPFGGGAGQYRAPPPGYEAPHVATPPTKVLGDDFESVVVVLIVGHQVRPEGGGGALESPGLDDFAHLGLITDLLE